MKFQALFTVGCVVLCCACTPAERAETVAVEIDPQLSTPDSVLLTDREIIVLKTHPEALLSRIQTFDIYRDKLYIFDQRIDKLLVFDLAGNFVSTIGRRGRGPGEFSSLLDFCIDRENDEILIATDRPNRILYYSLAGKFLGETPVDDILFEFVKEGNKIYSHLMLYDGPEFAIYELEGRAVKSTKYPEIPKLKRNPNGGTITMPLGRMLNASKHGMLFTRTFDNTIYKVENDELVPFRTMDFGKYYLEEARNFSTEEVSGLGPQGIIYAITNARLMDGDRMVFNGFPDGVFTVDGDSARQYGRLTNELTFHTNTDIVPILDPETEYVAFSHTASGFADYYGMVATDSTRYTDEMARLSHLKAEDNPVIFLYKLRSGASPEARGGV